MIQLHEYTDWRRGVKRRDGKISAQSHTALCIQFLDRENNDKNNRLPLGLCGNFTPQTFKIVALPMATRPSFVPVNMSTVVPSVKFPHINFTTQTLLHKEALLGKNKTMYSAIF